MLPRMGSEDAGAASERRAAWLEACCAGFALLGVVLPLAYDAPLFAPWRAGLEALLTDPASARGTPTLGLLLGITGGSIAGKWVAHLAIVRCALRRRLRWARYASIAGLLSWFLLDSAVSISEGALFNVLWVNLAPLLVFGVPLLAAARRDDGPTPPARRSRGLRRAALAVQVAMAVGALSGVVIAAGPDTIAFAPWRAALADAHFGGGAIPHDALVIARVLFGPIGGTVLAQFVLLAAIARFAIARGEAWGAPACAASLLAWFAVDAGWSFAHDAAFNAWMVDVPTLLLTLPPLAWAAREVARARARPAGAGAHDPV